MHQLVHIMVQSLGKGCMYMKRIIGTSAFKNGFLKKDRFFLSLLVLLGIGIFIGAVTAGTNSADSESVLSRIWSSYMEKRLEQSIAACFFGSFFSAFVLLALSYILGMCAIGEPFLYTIPIIDGIGKGIIFGFVYVKYGFLGLLKSLLLIAPQNVLFCLILIFSLKRSVSMSRQTYNTVRGIQQTEVFLSFKKYNQYFIILLIGMIICSIIDALMSRLSGFIIG